MLSPNDNDPTKYFYYHWVVMAAITILALAAVMLAPHAKPVHSHKKERAVVVSDADRNEHV